MLQHCLAVSSRKNKKFGSDSCIAQSLQENDQLQCSDKQLLHPSYTTHSEHILRTGNSLEKVITQEKEEGKDKEGRTEKGSS